MIRAEEQVAESYLASLPLWLLMHATPPIPHPANLRPQLYEFDLYRPLLFDHLCGNEESFYRSYFFTRKISTSSFIKVYIYDLLQIAAFFLFFSLLVPHPPFSKVDHYGSLVHIYTCTVIVTLSVPGFSRFVGR